MLRRARVPARLLFVPFLFYLLLIGGTYDGVWGNRELSITLIAFAMLIWFTGRTRNNWRWRVTALDGAMLLWMIAFVVSLAANIEAWRRISIGMWFAFAYIGLWYFLHDLLANRAIKREHLVNILLIVGLFVLLFGYVQIPGYIVNELPLILSRRVPFDLPRPGSIFGANPDALGAFLIVLIPLLVSRIVSQRYVVRWLMILYTLLTLILLFLTYSRGAWGALCGALLFQLLLILWAYDLVTPHRLRQWWSARSTVFRGGLISFGLFTLAALVVASVIVVRSLGQDGRSIDQRTGIYRAAWMLFVEQPLSGHGLFTFGAGQPRLQSTPPVRPHSHAHDIPLQVAAELGVIGLAALALSVYLAIRAMRRNWIAASLSERIALSGAIAAVLGFGLQHLIDIPAMIPTIALTGLVALVLAVYPVADVIPAVAAQRRVYGLVVMSGFVILLAAGAWSSSELARYTAALKYGLWTEDFRGAAERLQPVIDADPSMVVTSLEQGYYYGLAANDGNAGALSQAVADYRRFTSVEPTYAFAWANLSVLEWQLGQKPTAISSMAYAAELAPDAWPFTYKLGQYYEDVGDHAKASEAYAQAVMLEPDIILLPEWNESAIRAAAGANAQLSDMGRLLRLIDTGQMDAAHALFSQYPVWASHPRTAEVFTLEAIFLIDKGDLDAAATSLKHAADIVDQRKDEVWVNLGLARLAHVRGDATAVAQALADAQAALTLGPFDVDFLNGVNIITGQYLYPAIPRMFLPQVKYPFATPAASHFFDTTERLVKS